MTVKAAGLAASLGEGLVEPENKIVVVGAGIYRGSHNLLEKGTGLFSNSWFQMFPIRDLTKQRFWRTARKQLGSDPGGAGVQ